MGGGINISTKWFVLKQRYIKSRYHQINKSKMLKFPNLKTFFLHPDLKPNFIIFTRTLPGIYINFDYQQKTTYISDQDANQGIGER
jgi:hypothetical protein